MDETWKGTAEGGMSAESKECNMWGCASETTEEGMGGMAKNGDVS